MPVSNIHPLIQWPMRRDDILQKSQRPISLNAANQLFGNRSKLTVRCSCRPWLRCCRFTVLCVGLAWLCLVVVFVALEMCWVDLSISALFFERHSSGCFLLESVLQLPGFSFGTRQHSEIQSSRPGTGTSHFSQAELQKREEERRRIGRLNCCCTHQ